MTLLLAAFITPGILQSRPDLHKWVGALSVIDVIGLFLLWKEHTAKLKYADADLRFLTFLTIAGNILSGVLFFFTWRYWKEPGFASFIFPLSFAAVVIATVVYGLKMPAEAAGQGQYRSRSA
ncbi:MAG TPA: hypothetical protein VD967_01540 [Candidatus Paceibacterota bacterium]|nr:hypothetical protein [Candidatus Paceibacterota bacterium]